MTDEIAMIGFGEAGQAFAGDAANWRAYDIDHTKSRQVTLAEALAGALLIFSVVTADQARGAAWAAAECIEPNALFLDMNSVAPGTKQDCAHAIEGAGGRYVDVAVMSPVNPKKRATPLLLSGPHADAALEVLAGLGFSDVRVVGSEVGRASTIKMLRSVMYKGVEALTAECLLACEKAGVTDEVLRSFGNDWASGADYRLDRMMVHGIRRSEEMREVVKTLEDLGTGALLTRGTVERQAAIGSLGIKAPPSGLNAKLAALAKDKE